MLQLPMHCRAGTNARNYSNGVVQIAIPNWNGRQFLDPCLRAVFSLEFRDFSVTVVDNGSTDGSAEFVRRTFPQVRVIQNPDNRGFAAATNQAIEQSQSEFVATLNNDTEVDPGWLGALVRAMESDARVGMCASKMVLADHPGVIDSAGIAVDRAGIAWGLRGGEVADGEPDHCREVFGPNGGAALYRRSMLDQIGLFDADFFAYLEDADLAWRAQWAGWKCLYVSEGVVRHVHSATGGREPVSKRRLLGRNKAWMIAKNYPLPQLVWYAPLIMAYDLMALAYAMRLRGGAGALRGRFEALGGIGRMVRKRRDTVREVSAREMMARLSPLEVPWRIAQRYVHLRGTE